MWKPFSQGARNSQKNASAARGHPERPLSRRARPRRVGSRSRTAPPGHQAPGRRGDRHDSAEWDSHLHSPRSSAAPRVVRSPEPRRAPGRWCSHAAERFPGDTGGRSPAVAKAVARAPRAASPAAKVTGGEHGGEALDGSPASACLAPAAKPFC